MFFAFKQTEKNSLVLKKNFVFVFFVLLPHHPAVYKFRAYLHNGVWPKMTAECGNSGGSGYGLYATTNGRDRRPTPLLDRPRLVCIGENYTLALSCCFHTRKRSHTVLLLVSPVTQKRFRPPQYPSSRSGNTYPGPDRPKRFKKQKK